MYNWRITKYNPIHRNKKGHYQKDEWTDFCEIGKTFNGDVLTEEAYLRVEKTYVLAVVAFLECLGLGGLKVDGLENQYSHDWCITPTENMRRIKKSIREGQIIQAKDIPDLVTLVLRNQLWCRLVAPFKMYVHFGWDYYMYIGCKCKCEEVIGNVRLSGLYIEDFISPYQKPFLRFWQRAIYNAKCIFRID